MRAAAAEPVVADCTTGGAEVRCTVPVIPFVEWLGIRTERASEGESVLRHVPTADHLNAFDVVHGGVCMTLLDVAMAVAARSVEPGMGVVTIEMKTSFLRPAKGELVCQGRLLHRTATMAFTEANVVDAAGKTCAHATGTFKYVRRLATGRRSVQGMRGAAEKGAPVLATHPHSA